MKEENPPETVHDLEHQIRALGYDPSHLTPDEQVELVEIESLLGGSAIGV